MRSFKSLLIAAVFMAIGTSAFAADATVTFVSGKVEVQRNGKWVALQKGDTVGQSETISTGFQSEAKIKILESVMYLGPVTRITLEELSSTDQKDNVNVYLKTGTTRSQVRHTDNKRINYQVHTAVAVASCRGTEWIIDDSNNITCFEGMVAVAPYVEDNSFVNYGTDEGEGAEEGSEEETSEEEGKASDAAGEAGAGAGAVASDASGAAAAEDTKVERTEVLVTERPTSNDGVLVRANQTVSVSVTAAVSAPVNTIVTAANKVTTTVSTVAEKEAVASSSVPASVPDAAVEKPSTDTEVKTGSVVVTFTFEE